MQLSVGLVVNSYERTYRDVLRPGYFSDVVASNLRSVDEVVALINNVQDAADARDRAEALVEAGEISSYAFVRDHIADALAQVRLPHRYLRRRPYLLDYGLVMPHVVSTDWLLGWDAETRLSTPTNWIDPSIDLMISDPRVFHASLNWHPLEPDDTGLEAETVEVSGDFALNWGFSDQLFLLRRAELTRPIFRSFAPAAIVRHAPHPYTFEYRVESHQRAARRFRATLENVYYETNTIPGGVLARTGGSARDRLQLRFLRAVEFHVVDRLPKAMGPRFRKS